MTQFAAPIAQQIWDMKYRLKEADGTEIDHTVQDTWRRIAKDLAKVEADPAKWEEKFYDALEGFKFLPAGRITAGAERAVRSHCSTVLSWEPSPTIWAGFSKC